MVAVSKFTFLKVENDIILLTIYLLVKKEENLRPCSTWPELELSLSISVYRIQIMCNAKR